MNGSLRGTHCNIMPHGVRMLMRKVRSQPRTTRVELVNDLMAVGITDTKQTIGNTIHHHGLKSCSVRKVHLFKKGNVLALLTSANEHLNDSKKDWQKELWSNETKPEFFGINSICLVWRKKNADYDSNKTIHTMKHRGGNIDGKGN